MMLEKVLKQGRAGYSVLYWPDHCICLILQFGSDAKCEHRQQHVTAKKLFSPKILPSNKNMEI